MRVIIAGGRDFNDYEFAKEYLLDVIENQLTTIDTLISGGARGADKIGERFANEFNYPVKIFPADWNKYGKRAGYLRNEQMAKYASECGNGMLIAFWDGQSKGTKHMIDLAHKYGLRVKIVNY